MGEARSQSIDHEAMDGKKTTERLGKGRAVRRKKESNRMVANQIELPITHRKDDRP